MPEEREDVETKSSGSPEVYQQTKFMAWFEKAFPGLLVSGAAFISSPSYSRYPVYVGESVIC